MAQFEIIALDTGTTDQLRAPGAGDSYLAPRNIALRDGTNAMQFDIYRSYVDGSNLGYTALKQDASGGFIVDSIYAGSVGAPTNILDVRTNGTSRFTIANNGYCQAAYFACAENNTGGITVNYYAPGIQSGSVGGLFWTNGFANATRDTGVVRSAASIIKITDGSTGGGTLESLEVTEPSAPAANGWRLYGKDNGSGKTQLCVRFNTGAVQVLATEP